VIDMAKPRRSQGRQGADSFLTLFVPSAISAEWRPHSIVTGTKALSERSSVSPVLMVANDGLRDRCSCSDIGTR
jgi:hypothetical protein